jgi:uncharacterized protein (TIGR02646 family)
VIRISKPADPPEVLSGRGAESVEQLRREYDNDPAGCRSGDKALPIQRSIYAHATVINALRVAQHRKCCFCERKSLGDIEHFRPKSGFQQSPGEALEKPGYYWLAYNWDNLFLACGPCNQRFKRNLFPLANPQNRARCHHDDLAAEQPLLLHPASDDPQAHIGFREEIAYPIGNSARGRACIEILGLNHEELVESRRAVLSLLLPLMRFRRMLVAEIEIFRDAGQSPPTDLISKLAEIEAVFREKVQADAEFSAMTRAALEGEL